MDTKTKLLAATCALLLSACASTGVRVGAAYGNGDYYTAARRERFDDWPWSYNVGIASWGGYCSVRYRYCLDPFLLSVAWYGGWYSPYYHDPYWSPDWLYFRRGLQPRREGVPFEPVAERRTGPAPEAWQRPQPRAWEERPAPRRGGVGGARTRSRPTSVTGGRSDAPRQ
jgi:hypothetical protein